jgi:hypothetical protein
MEKLKIDSEVVHIWVEDLVPNTWIKAFFNDFPKCDILLNNHPEVFNMCDLISNPFLQYSVRGICLDVQYHS